MTISFHDRPDAFAADECERMIRLAGERVMEPATIWGGTQDVVDSAVRNAERIHLSRTTDAEWIFARLDTLFADAATRFELTADPVFEDIQIVRYATGAHFNSWHSDAGTDRWPQRQISISVELSDPMEHDGGVLEIVPALGGGRTLPRGGARLFPSRMIHRVTPVTRGVRYALVAWTGQRG